MPASLPATITTEHKLFVVRWRNVGNDLQNQPRAFWTEQDARNWCAKHGLRVS